MLICSNEILFTCFFFGILNEFWFKSFGYNDRSSPVYIEYYPEILHHLIENATLLHITSLKFTLCCDIRVACFHFDKRKKNFARLYVLKSQMEFFFSNLVYVCVWSHSHVCVRFRFVISTNINHFFSFAAVWHIIVKIQRSKKNILLHGKRIARMKTGRASDR